MKIWNFYWKKALIPISLITFIKLKRRKNRKFMKSFFKYDKEKDCYYCSAAFEIPFTRNDSWGEIKAGIKGKFELE